MCRLLIYSGFNPKQRDNFGQTPLHLGCLSGSLNTVQVLVEQDIELEAVDFNGNVPKKLAEGSLVMFTVWKQFLRFYFFRSKALGNCSIFGKSSRSSKLCVAIL